MSWLIKERKEPTFKDNLLKFPLQLVKIDRKLKEAVLNKDKIPVIVMMFKQIKSTN